MNSEKLYSKSAPTLQVPSGFGAATKELEEKAVPPVEVPMEPRKRKNKSKHNKKNKSKKARAMGPDSAPSGSGSTPSPSGSATPPAPTRDEIITTFPECYQGIIKMLPVCLWPSVSRGQHSYTVRLVCIYIWLCSVMICFIAQVGGSCLVPTPSPD